ncbi:MAG: septum formation initiator family protein [Lutibacter sp.]|jgi:cell division protein FtsB|nr:septum formation initiator family protein [Lutibacter sp.]
MTLKQIKNKPFVKFITNRYVMILAIFFIWMVFFDENSWVNHHEFDKEIDKLQSEKEYYQSQIDSDNAFINKHNDREELEKFAREQYKMKKETEEIYLIEFDTIPKKK